MTVIVILALVALFIGLRLYSVLGERTGHEQQPILKPADPEAVVEPRVNRPTTVQPSVTDGADMGCDTVQGYVFAEPMFEAEYLDWTRDASPGEVRIVA